MSRLVERILTGGAEDLPLQENWDFVATDLRDISEPDDEQRNTLRSFWAGLVRSPVGNLNLLGC